MKMRIRGLRDVRIPDIGDGDEDLEGILLVGFSYASFDFPLNFGLPLLSVS